MKYKVEFKKERCKSCGLCIESCPINILSYDEKLNDKGYKPATIVEQEKCIGCKSCGKMCPDSVITIYKLSE